MFFACHFSIERQVRGVVAANVMRYFDTSAKHRQAEEKEDHFTALIETGHDGRSLR
jgi:hypothetical protein